jgi:ankyrin repeat protein
VTLIFRSFLLARFYLNLFRSQVSLKTLTRVLQRLPSGLHGAVGDALKRVKVQNSSMAELGLKVLVWLSGVTRPLKVSELQHAVGTDEMDDQWDDSGLIPADIILNSAAGLVEFDPLSGTITLIHFSVKEILEADYPEALSQKHAIISKTCMTYMKFPEFQSDHMLAYDQIAEWLLQKPFLGYCAENWGLHARAAPESAVLSSILKAFKSDEASSTAFMILYAVKWEMIDSCPKDASICHLAAFFDLSETLRTMLASGTPVDVYDEYFRTPLYLAASSGHLESTMLLLDSKAAVTGRFKPEDSDYTWQTSKDWWLPPWARSDKTGDAVEAAAEFGHQQVVKMLCEAGADFRYSSGIHGTPLEAASFNGRIEVVKWLLQRTTVGVRALNAAVYNGNAEILEMLVNKIENDANTKEEREDGYWDPTSGILGLALYAAALLNRTNCAEVLLRHNVSASSRTEGMYRTPMQAAASQNHLTMLLRFAGAGADINDLDLEYVSNFDRVAHLRIFNGLGEDEASSTFATSQIQQVDPKTLDGYQMEEEDIRFYQVQTRRARSLSRTVPESHDATDPEFGAALYRSYKADRHGSALQAASFSGHEETVAELLNLSVEVNLFGGYYGTALQAAAAGGHLTVVQQLVEHGAYLTTLTGFYGNPLTAAAARGHLSVVQHLLDRGANPKARGGEYGYALSAAARNGSVEICQILLSAGADVNAYGGAYAYALQAACIGIPRSSFEERAATFAQKAWKARRTPRELEDFFQSIRDAKAFSNVRTEAVYGTMLQRAAGGAFGNAQAMFIDRRGLGGGQSRVNELLVHATEHCDQQLKVLQLLLDQGASINSYGGDFGTALIAAAVAGRLALCELLLSRGADPNMSHKIAGNIWEQTPVEAALRRGHHDVVQLLFQTGNISMPDYPKRGSLLHTAVDRCPESIELLIENGADVNKMVEYSGTPLHVAVKSGNTTAVVRLIQHGANVNIYSRGDWNEGSPIECICDFSNTDILRLLIEAGTAPESNTKALRRLVTMFSYSQVSSESINLLIAHGAKVADGKMWDPSDPEKPDTIYQCHCYNSIIGAVCNGTGSRELYALLLNKVNKQVEGLNALWYSAWRNDLELVTMFLDLGVKPTQELVSHIEDRGVEQGKSGDIAAEMREVHLGNEERGHRTLPEILALLKANV